jgi:hypothetical protein
MYRAAVPTERKGLGMMLSRSKTLAVCAGALAAALTTGCAGRERAHAKAGKPTAAQAEFWSSLESLCGRAFEGRVVEDSTNDPRFARSPLVMHVMRCEGGRILVPFHIADDHSRTWVFTRTPSGLRLKHDHRHADGSEDAVTQYGGDTRDPGTPISQRFHADEHTAALIPAAVTNVWTVEVVPARTFAYMLERPGTDRRFRVEFDLSRVVPAPAPPWGW